MARNPRRSRPGRNRPCAGLLSEALLEADGNGVASILPDRLSDVLFHGELVVPVAHRHEGALEGLAIDRAADLDETSGAEELRGLRPDHVGVAALRRALQELRGET